MLSHQGYVAAIRHCLLIELGIAPALALLAWLLPRRPRDAEAAAAPQRPVTAPVTQAVSAS